MTDRNAEEMPSARITLPDGYVGNLTDDQHHSLVRMWESYFDICDRARGNASKGMGFQESADGKDLKKSGIPDDDKAKDEAKRMQEQQGMNELMETYGPEALRDSWWQFVRGDSPDGNMLRFIRARKGDVGRGLAMMATCLKWRLDTDVESFVLKGDLTNGEEIPKFVEQQKSGKVFSLGCTTKEQPICYVIMKYHSMFAQPAASMQKFIVTQMETFRLLMHPPNDKATIFFDLKGFGLKQMDVVSLLYLVKVLESYYPESLGTMYISNAPLIFWGFWRAVKNLLDPVVRNKIKFISTPADTEGDVPEEQMIKYCGGKVISEFSYVDARDGENGPQEDSELKERLLQRHRRLTDKFEEVTRAWCKTGGEDEGLQKKRDVLQKKLRLSQFELEPVTRGLTAYHRNGVIPPENYGISVFDYKLPDGEVRRQVLGKKSCRKSIEQELYAIAKNGATAAEAEKQIASSVEDGSWGEWRVNDNSDEVKRVALASLDDLDNTGDLKLDGIDPQGTAVLAAKQTPSNIVQAYRKAAVVKQHKPETKAAPVAAAAAAPAPAQRQEAQQQQQQAPPQEAVESDNHHKEEAVGAAGAAAAGAGAVAQSRAAKSNGSAPRSNGNGNADQYKDYSAPRRSSPPQQSGDSGYGGSGRVTNYNRPINGGNNPTRPRGRSATSGPSPSGPTNYADEESPSGGKAKGGMFGSIKAKLGLASA